jgi:hypothetical protein
MWWLFKIVWLEIFLLLDNGKSGTFKTFYSDDLAVLHVFRPYMQIICGKILVR